jgi:L-2-hydroxycarboxylate dehydrogenase (NAD+)
MEVRNVKRYKEEGVSLDDKLLSQLKEIAEEVSLDLEEIIGGK